MKKKFRCLVCGYVYEGDAAPAECPICHAKAEKFEEIKAETTYQISLSAKSDKDVTAKIKEALIRIAPEDFINPPAILENLVDQNDTVILVTPIDKEAPKGR